MAKGRKIVQLESWKRMEDVETEVKEIVSKYHPHLESAVITVFGKPKAAQKGDKLNVAKAMRPAELVRVSLGLAGLKSDYLIVIGLDVWNTTEWKGKVAILDHELTHMSGKDDKGRWRLVGHDIEEFTAVLERQGAYTYALKRFVKAAQQLELPA